MTKFAVLRNFRSFFTRRLDVKTQALIKAAIVGVLIGIVGVTFRLFIEQASHILHYGHYVREHWYQWLYLPMICMSGGLIASYLTQRFAPDASGSGIPQVKYALNTRGAKIRLRTVVTKFVAAMLGIASGLSLGREGPTIHIGAGMSDKIATAMGSKNSKKAIASGAGAGLAAAFNTPIAGVMFVLEELDHDFSSLALGPAIVGAVSASVTCRMLYGDYFIFHFQSDAGTNLAWVPFYILLGIIAGGFAAFFQKAIIFSLKFYEQTFKALPKWTFGAIAGLLTGVVGLWIPEAIGGGHTTLEGTLAQAYIWWLIPIIFFFKFLMTLVAYGSGVPGGIFAPSLVLGALLGVCVGNFSNALFPELAISPASFAFVGMGAFFTGISRAPITSIVMLFELTGNYNLILPLMFACIIANVTAEQMRSGSVYEDLLKHSGLEIEEQNHSSYLKRFNVEEAMTHNVEAILPSKTIGELRYTFSHTHHRGFPIINQQSKLVGVVTRSDIDEAFDQDLSPDTTVSEIMINDLITISPKDSLQTAVIKFYEHKIGRLLVVDPLDSKRLIGLISRSDIINFEAAEEIS